MGDPGAGTPRATDLELLLTTRHGNGDDHWATPDGHLGVERPVSTLTALLVLGELRVPRSHEAVRGAAERVLRAVTPQGAVRVAPTGSIQPCHTALAAAALCRNGYADEPRVQPVLEHLRSTRWDDGGWRCRKFSYGHGPETDHSNPGVTLHALDALRWGGADGSGDLDRAVTTLLEHWTVRTPLGPCHFGVGSRFMEVEYPFWRYNLFYVTHVLSFYAVARRDPRFHEALGALQATLDDRGRVVVGRTRPSLAGLRICRRGEPSRAATDRYREILANLGR
jgi:hypothetical protein